MKKLIALTLTLVVLTSCITVSAQADTVRKVSSLADGIIAYEMRLAGADSVQALIDGTLSAKAGNSAEWLVITLGQRGSYDFSAYLQSLLRYISEKNPSNKVGLQKYALAMYAAGCRDADFLNTVTDKTFSKQGIMSVIYGLHLLNNGAKSELYTQESALSMLLDRQLDDGGWALNGTIGNIDITAMAVQALAPHAADERVNAAVEKAVALMSSLQEEDGCYSSYGVKNPESAAQVLCALSSLGIDFASDERFIKNGNSLMDALLPFLLEGGGFSHTLGGEYNATSSVQVLYALVSYERMVSGKAPFYIFDFPAEPLAAASEKEGTASDKEGFSLSRRAIIALSLAGVSVLALFALMLLGKNSKKNLLALLGITALVIALVLLIDIQAPSEYYTGSPVKKDNPVGRVKMSIRCDTLVGSSMPSHLPEDGVILPETEFEISRGDTAFTVLTDAARAFGLHIEKSGAAGMIYVTGINNLYEFDFGDLSGWNYFVNGENVSVGCDQLVLRDQDNIEWRYTLALGKDLN